MAIRGERAAGPESSRSRPSQSAIARTAFKLLRQQTHLSVYNPNVEVNAMRWRCIICGYIHEGDKPPFQCPICGAPAKMFERLDGEDTRKGDPR